MFVIRKKKFEGRISFISSAERFTCVGGITCTESA